VHDQSVPVRYSSENGSHNSNPLARDELHVQLTAGAGDDGLHLQPEEADVSRAHSGTQARVAELRVAHRPRCSSVNEAQGSTRARLTMTRGSRAGAAAMVEALVGGARVGGSQCSRWSCGRRQPMFEAELGSQDNAQGGTNGRKCKRKSSTNFLEHFRVLYPKEIFLFMESLVLNVQKVEPDTQFHHTPQPSSYSKIIVL
jgi:hypothetical protein